jgi:hypothetical protein
MPRSCRDLRGASLRVELVHEIALEHRRERNVQGFADLEQASRAHAVRSFFVFLYLLERDAQFFAWHGLTHTKRKALLAYPSADILVDGFDLDPQHKTFECLQCGNIEKPKTMTISKSAKVAE